MSRQKAFDPFNMNIGIFTDTYKPNVNGVVTSVETLRMSLEASGQKVSIFAPNDRLKYGAFPKKRSGKL